MAGQSGSWRRTIEQKSECGKVKEHEWIPGNFGDVFENIKNINLEIDLTLYL